MANATRLGDDNQYVHFHASMPWAPVLATGFVIYATICYILRFQRINKLRDQHGFTDRGSIARMSNEQAQAIVHSLVSLEFPSLYELALQVALLKTYAVKNIAQLLVSVSDFAKENEAPKRYEDTEVIFACFTVFHPNSPTLHRAVARMNYLHAPYIKSGKISNADLLYVLYASMSEPVRFMRLFEWRELTDMEIAAIATLWKYIGDMMNIDYEAELHKREWADAIEFMEDLSVWGKQYEDEYMKPFPEVKILGGILINMFLSAHPKFVRPLGYQIVCALMGDRLRRAFDLPEPGIAVTSLSYSLLFVRMLTVRFLCLPRLTPVRFITDPDPKTGRIKHSHYLKEPWYHPVTFRSRWGPAAWVTWATGGILPGDKGKEMKPEGFLFEDVGPRNKVGKGIEELAQLQQRAQQATSGGSCPFSMHSSPKA